MSKNGSRSALKFLGRKWGTSAKNYSNISIFLGDSLKSKALKKEWKISKQFLELTEKFAIRDVQLKRSATRYSQLEKVFLKMSFAERKRVLVNTKLYKEYCYQTGNPCSLENYLESPFFKQKRTIAKKTVRGKRPASGKITRKSVPENNKPGHTLHPGSSRISESLDAATLEKLRALKKTFKNS